MLHAGEAGEAGEAGDAGLPNTSVSDAGYSHFCFLHLTFSNSHRK